MTQLLQEIALAAGGSLQLSLLLKLTAVLLLGLAVAAAARRARASRRHLVLTTAFAVLLVLPAAATLVAPITIDVPAVALPPGVLSLESSADQTAGTVVAHGPAR